MAAGGVQLTGGADTAMCSAEALLSYVSGMDPRVMVPRGGIQVKKIPFCFQILRGMLAASATNINTNKIFLWIGSVPAISLNALHLYLVSSGLVYILLGHTSSCRVE
ncbi:hypothetical protein X766_00055 [Mesorhizobium sp. LSJC255A00]|nr:hypothetical protein X766_00055 [Mesorhizobium sp. LSJC255A00]